MAKPKGKKEEENLDLVEEPKVEKEVKTVEVSYTMKYNVLHNGVKFQKGDVVPAELVELFTEKGFVDKELKEL